MGACGGWVGRRPAPGDGVWRGDPQSRRRGARAVPGLAGAAADRTSRLGAAPARRRADDRDHAALEAADGRPQTARLPVPERREGRRIRLHGEAVYCLRRFRDLIGDMAETAWVRFVRRLPRNEALIGEGPGPARVPVRLGPLGARHCPRTAPRGRRDRCFYCAGVIRGEPAVDHFVPWARYPLDLGHNYVLADARCNGVQVRSAGGLRAPGPVVRAERAVARGRRHSRPAAAARHRADAARGGLGLRAGGAHAVDRLAGGPGRARRPGPALARRPPAVVGPVAQRVIGFARRAPGSIASQSPWPPRGPLAELVRPALDLVQDRQQESTKHPKDACGDLRVHGDSRAAIRFWHENSDRLGFSFYHFRHLKGHAARARSWAVSL